MSGRDMMYREEFKSLLSKGFNFDDARRLSVVNVDERLDCKKQTKMAPMDVCNAIFDVHDPAGALVREKIFMNGRGVNPAF